jgi:hypothetical protein
MYNHNNLLPAKIASKSGIRAEFASIAFCGNRTIATDTFRLLEVSAEGEATAPAIIDAALFKATTIPKKTLKFELSEIEKATNTVANPHINYPDVDQIMGEKAGIEYASIKINGELLGELLVAMSKINKFGIVELKVPLNQAYTPVHIYARTEDLKQNAHGLCMPVNRQ